VRLFLLPLFVLAVGCSFDLGGTPRPDSDGGVSGDGAPGDGAGTGGGGGVMFLPPQKVQTDLDP